MVRNGWTACQDSLTVFSPCRGSSRLYHHCDELEERLERLWHNSMYCVMDLGCRRAPLGEEESNFSIFEGFSVCDTQKKDLSLFSQWFFVLVHLRLLLLASACRTRAFNYFCCLSPQCWCAFLRYEFRLTLTRCMWADTHSLYICVSNLFCSEPPKIWWYRREASTAQKKEQKPDTLGGGGGGAEKSSGRLWKFQLFFFGSKLLCRVACVWERKKEKSHKIFDFLPGSTATLFSV